MHTAQNLKNVAIARRASFFLQQQSSFVRSFRPWQAGHAAADAASASSVPKHLDPGQIQFLLQRLVHSRARRQPVFQDLGRSAAEWSYDPQRKSDNHSQNARSIKV